MSLVLYMQNKLSKKEIKYLQITSKVLMFKVKKIEIED